MTQDLPPQEGLSLLDLFVMAVESWWLILLGAVLAAGATFFLTSDQPSTYYSRATLSAPAAWVETYLEGNPESEAATTDFAVTSDSANNAIVTVWSDTAETATTTLQAFVEGATASLAAERRQPLDTTIAALNLRIAQVQELSDEASVLSSQLQAQPQPDASALASVLDLRRQLQNEQFLAQQELASLEATVAQITQTVVVQAASEPTRSGGRNTLLLSALAGIGVGLALLLFFLLRSAIRLAVSNPNNAGTISRLRAAAVPWRKAN